MINYQGVGVRFVKAFLIYDVDTFYPFSRPTHKKTIITINGKTE